MRPLFAIVSTILLGACTAPCQTDWKAGVARADITPVEPIWMAGFGSRQHPSERIREHIYTKALAIQDEAGAVSVLVTADLVDTKRDVWDIVAERCRERYGIARERLWFNESHNHSAPIVTRVAISVYYPLTPDQESAVRRYTAYFIDKAVSVVGQAIANLAPARLEFQQGLAGIAVNRRRVRLRALPGPVDQDVPVLAVRDVSGTLRAVVVGYSCHATALSDYEISGDWPGYAQQEIERLHPGTTALFVQGCGADSNALPRGTVPLAQTYGRILAAAVDEVLHGKMSTLSGPIHVAFGHVDVAFQQPPKRSELEKMAQSGAGVGAKHAQRLLNILDRDGKLIDRYPYPVQVWQLGHDLKIIILGGEVVVDYALRLKATYGADNTWVAGYSNDIFAYIPSLRVLREGGYEGGDAMIGEDFPGPFSEAIEETIVGKVHDLVGRTEP